MRVILKADIMGRHEGNITLWIAASYVCARAWAQVIECVCVCVKQLRCLELKPCLKHFRFLISRVSMSHMTYNCLITSLEHMVQSEHTAHSSNTTRARSSEVTFVKTWCTHFLIYIYALIDLFIFICDTSACWTLLTSVLLTQMIHLPLEQLLFIHCSTSAAHWAARRSELTVNF